MSAKDKRVVVLVHGWSVRSTETYGELPQRLRSEALRRGGPDLDVRHIWLSKYISFHDGVRLQDISRAFDAALKRELGDVLDAGRRFACITHSTGGPVVRCWLQTHYLDQGRRATPLSHLIMLAPANFGSALSQLGRSRLSRLKAWFDGMEPGTGVLDWLELGSEGSWTLNQEWLAGGERLVGARGVFPFVVTGQTIDRHLYDHVNAYTGEMGSDGVVRAAAANLNASLLTLTQEAPAADPAGPFGYSAPGLKVGKPLRGPEIPFAIVPGRAHSGDRIGIMRSVHDDSAEHPTVNAILACLKVSKMADYREAVAAFTVRRAEVQASERVERVSGMGPFERTFVKDPCCMLVMRVRDDQGHAVEDFDLVFTAGKEGDPDHLPPGFLVDRQRNRRTPNTITFYLNHAAMTGAPGVVDADGRQVRDPLPACERLGLRVVPYPQDGFVHYLPAELSATPANLKHFIRPDETVMVDIVLRRIVREGVFRMTRDTGPATFLHEPPGSPV